MKKRLTKFAQVAGIMLALAFTFSCSDDKDEGGNNGGSSSPSSSPSGDVSSSSGNNNGGGTNASGTFKDDRDGKSYKWVKIGEQVWMAENLNYNATDSKCYDNRESNCTTYGRLYDWYTATTVACPSGWYLPSNNEWGTLENTVGYSATTQTKLKSKSGWKETNVSGNGTEVLPYIKKMRYIL